MLKTMHEQDQYSEHEKLIIRSIFNEVSDEEKQRAEELCSNSEELHAFAEEVKKIQNISDATMNVPDIDEDKAREIFLSAVDKKLNKPKKRTMARILSIGAAAASLLLIAILVLNRKGANQNNNKIIASFNESVTDTLSDGSIVYLNENSELSWSTSPSKERIVNLNKGEVFFEVKRNELKKFIVKTPNATISVLGTEFNVEIKEKATVVSVISGKVAVEKATEKDSNVQLTRNETCTVSEKANLEIEPITNSNSLFWKNKTLVFNGVKLREAVETIAEIYEVSITIESESLKDIPLSARYEKQTIESLFDILKMTLDVSVEKDGSVYVIKEK